MLHTRPALSRLHQPAAPEHFLPCDRPRVPEPVVRNSEAAWSEFQCLLGISHDDPAFAPTLPPDFAPDTHTVLDGPAPIEPRQAQPLSVHDVMVEARRFNRVCPLPAAWQRLYDLLPGKLTTGRVWQPPPPITGHAWQATSAMPKRMCLRDHIEWAERQGALEGVMRFIKSLPESQWHHVGDSRRD